MNKHFNLLQTKKIVATVVLSVVALIFAVTGLTLLKANAQPLSSAIVNEDGTLNKLTPPTDGGYYGVAHYEFNEGALGKDSLGNFDLTVGSGVTYDETYGGAKIGGRLIAEDLEGASSKDFSDLVDGSFTMSFLAHISASGVQNARFICTGNDTDALLIHWRHSGFMMRTKNTEAGTKKDLTIGTKKEAPYTTDGSYVFSETKTWHRVTIIYDESNSTLKVLSTVMLEDRTVTFESKSTVTLDFGGYTQKFAIGGQSNTSYESTWSSIVIPATSEKCPTMVDFRIYSGAIDQAELDAIAAYDAANIDTNEENDNLVTAGMEKSLLANSSSVIGAYIRLSEVSGLRFKALLNQSYVEKFVDTYGQENVNFGIKLIRNHGGEKAYIYVPAVNNELVDGVYNFNAVITDLTQEYYATQYTAQVYVSYTVGDTTTYVVSDIPVEEKVRSISEVAQMALDADDGTLDEEVVKQLQAFIGQ